ncbi:peroxiredoxin [Roseibium porphyridii]|uniref:Glutathione-dependent peroxiredoxin n=1 Tax=Roseibium porphyridii TaxID=2866279 RepID=A0ABY8F0R4_9HYPH|nr:MULTISPECIES: peroxiredoxin [Stappiaceae]QFT33688.1 Hybrid peroxiredoxin hyPrx5 [Labrenzia sp. THAF82]WFE88949.1 peroxiredoxin [Roseibium sp. KMA01]
MTLKVGDRLPEATFKIMTEDGPGETTTSALTTGKTLVLFGVPGAFTPTCHMNHLPGFVEHSETLKNKGVDEIAVVSVNDVFVMDAWEKGSNTGGKITFLADTGAEFVEAVGLGLGPAPIFGHLRSQRFALIAKDGEVTFLAVEDSPGDATKTGAAAILEALG